MIEYRDFSDRVGENFRIDTPEGSVGATLTDCAVTDDGADSSSFTLTFTCEPGQTLPQGSYSVSGDGFGPELIFLVPVDNGRQLEAVFNRRSPE